MASQHTPGPWFVEDQGTRIVISSKSGAITHMSFNDDATRHDAHLIAAAPELLSVVQELEASAAYWSEYDVPIGIHDRVRAAIAKATGALT